jgi:hypothetical protein
MLGTCVKPPDSIESLLLAGYGTRSNPLKIYTRVEERRTANGGVLHRIYVWLWPLAHSSAGHEQETDVSAFVAFSALRISQPLFRSICSLHPGQMN